MARLGRRLLLLMILRLMAPTSSLPIDIEVSEVLSESEGHIVRPEYWEKFSNFMAKLDAAEDASRTHLLTMPHVHEFLVPPDLLDAIEAHLSNATWLNALGQEYLHHGKHNIDPLIKLLVTLGTLSERENVSLPRDVIEALLVRQLLYDDKNTSQASPLKRLGWCAVVINDVIASQVTVPRDILEKLCWEALSQGWFQADLQWWITGAVHTFFNSDEAKKLQREETSLFSDFIHNVFENSWMSPEHILKVTIKYHKARLELFKNIERAQKQESPAGTIDPETSDDTNTAQDRFWDDPNTRAMFGPAQTSPTASSTPEKNDSNAEHEKSTVKTRRKRDHHTVWTQAETAKDSVEAVLAESQEEQSGTSTVTSSVQGATEPDNTGKVILEHNEKTGTTGKSEQDGKEMHASNGIGLDRDLKMGPHHPEGLNSVNEISESQEPFTENQKDATGSVETIGSFVTFQTSTNGKTATLTQRRDHDRGVNVHDLEQAAKIAEVVENAIRAVEDTAQVVEVQFDKLQDEIEKTLVTVENRSNEHKLAQSNSEPITKENLEMAKASTSTLQLKDRVKQIDAPSTKEESVDSGSSDELETTQNVGWISRRVQQHHKLAGPKDDGLWDGEHFLTNEKPLQEVLTGVLLSSRDFREDIDEGGMDIFDITSHFQTVQLGDAVSSIVGEEMIEGSIADFDHDVELQEQTGVRTTEEHDDSSQVIAEKEEGSGVDDAQTESEQGLTTSVITETLQVIVEEVGPEEPIETPHDEDNSEEKNRNPGLHTAEPEDSPAEKGVHAVEEATLNEGAAQTKENKMVENVRETSDTKIGKEGTSMPTSYGKGEKFSGNKLGAIPKGQLLFRRQVDESVGENPVLNKEEQDHRAHESYPRADLSLANKELTGDNRGDRIHHSGHKSHPPLPNHDHNDPEHVHLVSESFDESSLHNADGVTSKGEDQGSREQQEDQQRTESHHHGLSHDYDLVHKHSDSHEHDQRHEVDPESDQDFSLERDDSHKHGGSHSQASGHKHGGSHSHDSGQKHDESHKHVGSHSHASDHESDESHAHGRNHGHVSGHKHDASHSHDSVLEHDESHKHGKSHSQDPSRNHSSDNENEESN